MNIRLWMWLWPGAVPMAVAPAGSPVVVPVAVPGAVPVAMPFARLKWSPVHAKHKFDEKTMKKNQLKTNLF